MPAPVPARIFFIQAREASKAVIFRRGPTEWTQMVLWDLEDDTFEFGQWIKKKIRPRRCDLSPSGQYLIYLVDNFEHMQSRTVISRPPFWSAIAAWEHHDPLWGAGGGLFEDEQTVALNNIAHAKPHPDWPIPDAITITAVKDSPSKEYDLWKGLINVLLNQRMVRDGWEQVEDKAFVEQETKHNISRTVADFWLEIYPEISEPIEPLLWEKKITKSTSLFCIGFYHSEHGKNFNTFYLGKKQDKVKLKGVSWADVDHRNRIMATKNGGLYASKVAKDGSVEYTNLELLLDLNGQKPTRMLTPDKMKGWD